MENLSPQQVKEEIENGNAILINIRGSEEIKQHGKISNSITAPRGLLEFYADPELPYYKTEFDGNKRIILQCASRVRSAMASLTLISMGYENVAHLDSGLYAWIEAGFPVE
ncbi:MAG: rhodanese-like domain-containing protein [Chitinophagaceae bacterium]